MTKALEVIQYMRIRYSQLANNFVYINSLTQLEEVWIEELEKATDKKVQEECIPGKPISVFTATSPKVSCIQALFVT